MSLQLWFQRKFIAPLDTLKNDLSVCKLGITKVLRDQGSLYSQKGTERTRAVNHTGVSPKWRKYKSKACIPSRNLRVDFINNLGTVLLTVLWQT